jgi:hypothetical protein
MTETDKVIYAELIEAAARILAWTEITNTPTPPVAHVLASEAADLRDGWKAFDDSDVALGKQSLPIVDAVVEEVFARANELRAAFVARIVGKAEAAAAVLRELKPSETKH